jgi:hypothetical protein
VTPGLGPVERGTGHLFQELRQQELLQRLSGSGGAASKLGVDLGGTCLICTLGIEPGYRRNGATTSG